MNLRLMEERRKALGLTHKEIGKALGVKRAAVTKWFLGLGVPDARRILPLADLLGITADRMLRDEPAPAERARGAA